jgi:hypothetical protein
MAKNWLDPAEIARDSRELINISLVECRDLHKPRCVWRLLASPGRGRYLGRPQHAILRLADCFPETAI